MYRIQLEKFEGPLDLLLFLIQRDEIDILDIPIARITDEYLGHVRLMETIDLDGVADFLYLASMLISIKVRMLLPQQEEESEPLDPRQELVERLLEYRRYKEAAGRLGMQHDERSRFFTRGEASASEFTSMPEHLVNTSTYNLISALRRILVDAPEEPTLAIAAREYSLAELRSFVLEAVAVRGVMSFAVLVRLKSKKFIIGAFLAVLEMAQLGQVVIRAATSENDFLVGPTTANG